MNSEVLTGDALEMLRTLPDRSVHCCVTSPPYFGLRDYGTGTWGGGAADCDHVMPPLGGTAKSTLGGLKADAEGVALGKTQPNKAQYGRVCGKCGAVRVDNQIGLEATPDCAMHGKVRLKAGLSRDQIALVVQRLQDAGLLYDVTCDKDDKE